MVRSITELIRNKMTNDDKLKNLLEGDEPEEKVETEENGFNPKFNVREEFAVWIRQQFPKLKKHAKKGLVYPELDARAEEVYQAALGAVNHGVTSTKDCANSRLYNGWIGFESQFREGE